MIGKKAAAATPPTKSFSEIANEVDDLLRAARTAGEVRAQVLGTNPTALQSVDAVVRSLTSSANLLALVANMDLADQVRKLKGTIIQDKLLADVTQKY